MGKYRSAPKNELDDQRALLDELMGMDRDLQEGERGHAPAHFSDDDVCKHYLCGLNPYALFRNTKSDLGQYDKREDDAARAQWEALPQAEKDGYGYEHDLLALLERLVAQCNAKVQRNLRRVRDGTCRARTRPHR